jgi:hypothetical protein
VEKAQVFISYSGHDSFEASLLQHAIESIIGPKQVTAWTYQRNQARSAKDVAEALKKNIRNSVATVFLVSPNTINGGAAQWMELAYADSFKVKTFILLHHLDYNELKAQQHGVPPLLLASHCNSASQWKDIIEDIRKLIMKVKRS